MPGGEYCELTNICRLRGVNGRSILRVRRRLTDASYLQPAQVATASATAQRGGDIRSRMLLILINLRVIRFAFGRNIGESQKKKKRNDSILGNEYDKSESA